MPRHAPCRKRDGKAPAGSASLSPPRNLSKHPLPRAAPGSLGRTIWRGRFQGLRLALPSSLLVAAMI